MNRVAVFKIIVSDQKISLWCIDPRASGAQHSCDIQTYLFRPGEPL